MNLQPDLLAVSDPLLRAYEFKKQDFSVLFSRAEDKRPFGAWGRYIRKPATAFQLQKQFRTFEKLNPGKEANIAILGGRQPDGSLLVIMDNDTPEAFAFAKEKYGNTFTVQSSPGRGHLYFKTDFLAANSKFDGGDIKGIGGYVIAPFSKRSDGTRYLPIAGNEIKSGGIDLPLKPSRLVAKQPSAFVFDVLKRDYKITGKKGKNRRLEFKSRSEAEYAAVLNLLQDGFTFTEIKAIFDSYASGHTKYKKWNKDSKTGGTYGNQAYLKQCYEQALKWQEKHQSHCSDEELNKLVMHLKSMKFDWRGGAGEERLYSLFLMRALKFGKKILSYSLDEMSIDTGKSKQSCAKILLRLQNHKWVEKVKDSTWNLACIWSLNLEPAYFVSEKIKKPNRKRAYKIPVQVDSSSVASQPSLQNMGQLGEVIDDLMRLEHDFFAFKLSVTRLYISLKDIGQSTKAEIARATGMGYGTISKGLKKLKDIGLVDRNGRIFSTVENPDLDKAAELLGMTGFKERKFNQTEYRRIERYKRARIVHLSRIGSPIYNLTTGEAIEC